MKRLSLSLCNFLYCLTQGRNDKVVQRLNKIINIQNDLFIRAKLQKEGKWVSS